MVVVKQNGHSDRERVEKRLIEKYYAIIALTLSEMLAVVSNDWP